MIAYSFNKDGFGKVELLLPFKDVTLLSPFDRKLPALRRCLVVSDNNVFYA